MRLIGLSRRLINLWLFVCVIGLWAFWAAPASAQIMIGQSTELQLQAELVADVEAVAPGAGFNAALQFQHTPGWHTYWRSPGIGQPTTLEWTLPEGWIAGDIDWSTPERIYFRDGAVSGHGYSGLVYLPAPILAPADAVTGSVAELKAKATWLVCEYETCIPGGAELTLSIPIAEETVFNAPVRDAIADMPMPHAGEDWTISAARDGDDIILSFVTDETVTDPHFFSHDEMIWHDTEQVYETGADGTITARMAIDSYYEGDGSLVSGVLAYTNAQGAYSGVLINAPVGDGGAVSSSLSLGFLAQALLFAFLGGLILNLMPCVLPILSLKALSLAKVAGEDAGAARRDGIIYAAGVILSFIAIAVGMLLIRSSFGAVGWGFQLQQPVVVMGLALLMMAIGLNLIGVFEIGGSVQGAGQSLTKGQSPLSSFFTGVLAVVVAAPCTAPFMASALGVAMMQPAAVAIAIFAALGLGLAFPYLLLSVAPATRAILPKPGPWMSVLNQVLAFPMFATGIWLLWVLGGQTGKDGMTLGLVAVFFVSLAAWAFGKIGVTWKVIASAGLGFSVLSMLGMLQVQSALAIETGARAAAPSLFEEVAYTPQALDDLLSEDRAVFIYFTADWCITCKVNERVAIKQPQTYDFFEEADITVMVGDWTSQDPNITAILSQYERAGVPMYLYFKPGAGADEGVLLPQVLTPSILKSSIEEAS